MLRFLLFAFCTANSAYAIDGQNSSHWLNLDYTYTDLVYNEPGVMTERGRLAGIRGELGINLAGVLGVSIGGEYQDGNLYYDGATFSGTPVKTLTKDYIRQTQILGHFMYGTLTISAGVAQRYWFDDLVISYRRRTRYDYMPIYITYRSETLYFKIEQDIWQKGWNKSHMSDVSATAHDVEFNLGKGNGIGAELGYVFSGGTMGTRVFIAYHKWDVKESDVQNDGTQNLIEPKNSTTEVKLGIGLGF